MPRIPYSEDEKRFRDDWAVKSVINTLRDHYVRTGENPLSRNYPTEMAMIYYRGLTWNEVLTMAGIPIKRVTSIRVCGNEWDRNARESLMIVHLKEAFSYYDRYMNHNDYEEVRKLYGDIGWYSVASILRHFGKWFNALNAAGLPTVRRKERSKSTSGRGVDTGCYTRKLLSTFNLYPIEGLEREYDVVTRYVEGESTTSIGKSYDVSRQRIHQMIKKYIDVYLGNRHCKPYIMDGLVYLRKMLDSENITWVHSKKYKEATLNHKLPSFYKLLTTYGGWDNVLKAALSLQMERRSGLGV